MSVSEEMRRFIAQHIHSVEQLEVLLLLEGTRPRTWTAEEVSAELRTSPSSAAGRLADLVQRGFVTSGHGDSPSYVYAPTTEELASGVILLRSIYAERRIAVIQLIFEKPDPGATGVRAFADAFRVFRRDTKGDGS